MNSQTESYVVYGGTFDPFHEGHLSVIEFLKDSFAKIIIAPTSSNPWKDAPVATFSDRLAMIELVLSAENIAYSREGLGSNIWLCDYPYVYSRDLAERLLSELGEGINWAVGADSEDSVAKWKDWEKLAIPIVVAPVSVQIHSEAIRSGREKLHSAIREFARTRQLYNPS